MEERKKMTEGWDEISDAPAKKSYEEMSIDERLEMVNAQIKRQHELKIEMVHNRYGRKVMFKAYVYGFKTVLRRSVEKVWYNIVCRYKKAKMNAICKSVALDYIDKYGVDTGYGKRLTGECGWKKRTAEMNKGLWRQIQKYRDHKPLTNASFVKKYNDRFLHVGSILDNAYEWVCIKADRREIKEKTV